MKNVKKIRTLLHIAIFALFAIQNKTHAVPTSFFKNGSDTQSNVTWAKIITPLVDVYINQENLEYGQFVQKTLNEAYLKFSKSIGVCLGNDTQEFCNNPKIKRSRFEKIVAIVGNTVNGPGFANPITMNIEVQNVYGYNKYLFQHELVHRLMYEHTDINIGPIGRLFSLAMIPAWWIEGLAEYFTKSVGIYESDAWLIHMSQTNTWPSWETLHALYSFQGYENEKGYVVSGAFLGWIFDQVKNKNILEIHNEITHKTFVPLFYSAIDNWLLDNTGKNGEQLYEEFKVQQKLKWDKFFEDKKTITSQNTPEIYTKSFPTKTEYKNENIIINDINLDYKKIKNSEVHFNLTKKTLQRLSTNSNLNLELKKKLDPEYNDENDNLQIYDTFETQNKNVFFETALQGMHTIYVDHKYLGIQKLKDLKPGQNAQFLGTYKNQEHCIVYILNDNGFQTRIEKACLDEKTRKSDTLIVLDFGYSYLTSGFIDDNDVINLLGYNKKAQGLYKYVGKKLYFLGYFNEKIEKIHKGKNISELLAWRVNYDDVSLIKIETKNFSETITEQTQNNEKENDNSKQNPSHLKTEEKNENQNNHEIVNSAPIRHKFIFAYPYPVPTVFGGPSLNIFAYPFQDEMERTQTQVYLGYYFSLKTFGGGLTYTINPVLQGLTFGISMNPLFNGVFYNPGDDPENPSNQKYNYLNQQSVFTSLNYNLFTKDVFNQTKVALTKYTSYPGRENPPETVGTQKTSVIEASHSLKLNLFERIFFISPESSPTDTKAYFNLRSSLFGSKVLGIDESYDANGNKTEKIDYQKLGLSVRSIFKVKKINLKYNALVRRTFGKNSFYLKEYYTPFQSGFDSSSEFLSALYYPIATKGNINQIIQNNYVWTQGASFDFPLTNDAEMLFLISYINNFKGILEYYMGGVSDDFSVPKNLRQSINVGASMDVDVKGFKFFPSLIYTQLTDVKGWGVIFKLSFSDLK